MESRFLLSFVIMVTVCFQLAPCASLGDPGDFFTSRDGAAVDAGAYARNQPRDFLEYGGWIYKVAQCFTYNFTTGTPENIPRETIDAMRPDSGVAIWHSHPGTKGTARDLPINFFSGEDGDEGVARDLGVPNYLNTPSLENKVFDPADNSTRTQKIYTPQRCLPQP